MGVQAGRHVVFDGQNHFHRVVASRLNKADFLGKCELVAASRQVEKFFCEREMLKISVKTSAKLLWTKNKSQSGILSGPAPLYIQSLICCGY